MDVSYGILAFRTKEKIDVLLIQEKNGDWGFPKGHPEAEETMEETVRRECQEETGVLNISIDTAYAPLSVSYEYEESNQKHKKSVTYLVGYTQDIPHITKENEIANVMWCSIQDALQMLSYENSRDLLRNVLKI